VVPGGTDEGAWVDPGPTPGAVFDVGSDLAWLLAGRVTALSFEPPRPASVRALDTLPRLAADGPAVDGKAWTFALADDSTPRRTQHAGELVLGLLRLDTLEHVEVQAEGDARFPGAETVARAARTRGASLAWSLEFRVRGVAVARVEGRLDPAAGPRLTSPEEAPAR
jgi:hypothetical protein